MICRKIVPPLLALILLSSCAIKQNIEPAELVQETQICVVKDTATRESFLDALKTVLSEKGISYRVVDGGSIPTECEWTTTYFAKWSWDLALYMSYVEIKVFHNGILDGEAVYDSTLGGANMNKFIDAEEKIYELVNELMKYKSAALYNSQFG